MSDLQLKIKVIQANGLQRGDKTSSDPFVVAKFMGLGKIMNSVQTSVVHNCLNPVWNQDLTLYPKSMADVLLLKVYDHDTLSKDNLLGMVEIPLERFFQKGWQDNWFQLMGRKGSWKSLIGGHSTWYNVPGQLHIQMWFGLSAQATGLASLSQPYAIPPTGQTGPYYTKESQTYNSGFNPVLIGPPGYQQPGLNSGIQQPGLNTGIQQPGLNTAYQQPGLNTGIQQPGLNTAYQQPGLNTGYQQPGLNSGFQQPGPCTGFHPVQNTGYIQPMSYPCGVTPTGFQGTNIPISTTTTSTTYQTKPL